MLRRSYLFVACVALASCGGSAKDSAPANDLGAVETLAQRNSIEGQWLPVTKHCGAEPLAILPHESFRLEEGFFVETRLFSEGPTHVALDGYIFSRVVKVATDGFESGTLRPEALKRVARHKVDGVAVDPPASEQTGTLSVEPRLYSARREGESFRLVISGSDLCVAGTDLVLTLRRSP